METTTPKRRVGRLRKIVPPPDDSENVPMPYRDSEWFCHRTPDDDNSEFDRLLIEERRILEGCTEPEWLVYQDRQIRELARIYHREFTVDGLFDFSKSYRSPFTHDGKLTPSGIAKACVLLCRQRIIAGIVAPEGRRPDFSKLKGYLPPLMWELMGRA